MDSTIQYFPPFDAIEVKQGKYAFYVFTIDSQDLFKIAYTSPRYRYRKSGIQRNLNPKRLKEIADYYTSKDEPRILPNCIIVSLSDDSYFKNGKLYIPIKEHGEAFVLDGQHRLFAFGPEYAKEVAIDLVVSAFIGVSDEIKAFIFRKINMTQRKINPSLVYDLIPMLRKDWITFQDYRSKAILDYLNIEPTSPWYDGVAMLGGRERPITQASFITRLKTLFKKGNVFEDVPDNAFFEQIIQIEVLVQYFQAVKEVFPKAWNNKKYILSKNTGFATMLNLLKPMMVDMTEREKILVDDEKLHLTKNDFKPYLEKIADFSFSSEEYGSIYLGEAGIRELTKELHQKIFG